MRNLKRILFTLTIAIITSTTALAAYTVENIPNVHIRNRTKYVSNPDGVLSQQTVVQADSIIAGIWRDTSAEVVAVVIKDFEGNDIDLFATQLFEYWGIGKSDKDNGVLILIATDRRKMAIRTGYGVEGALPDVICNRIIRHQFAPAFKTGDYDGGLIAGLRQIDSVLKDPSLRDELMSGQANDANKSKSKAFVYYAIFIVGLTIFWAIVYVSTVSSVRKLTLNEQYYKIEKLKTPLIVSTFFGLGLPIIILLPLLWKLKSLRNTSKVCINCGSKMNKLDEETDNLYLTPAQDTEEKINSVDYDVWLCPTCNSTEIIPYVNNQKDFKICSNCGARAKVMVSDRIIAQPTSSREGKGMKTYKCLNCHDETHHHYTIPKDESSSAAGAIILGAALGAAAGRRGGGFGGGISGGSFGGGLTGGGGSSGGW